MLTDASMLSRLACFWWAQLTGLMGVGLNVGAPPDARESVCVRARALGQHIQRHRASLLFQDGDRLLVCRPPQALPVHRQDLVAPFQTPVSSRRPLKDTRHLSELAGARAATPRAFGRPLTLLKTDLT